MYVLSELTYHIPLSLASGLLVHSAPFPDGIIYPVPIHADSRVYSRFLRCSAVLAIDEADDAVLDPSISNSAHQRAPRVTLQNLSTLCMFGD